jgi:hypothetical protein
MKLFLRFDAVARPLFAVLLSLLALLSGLSPAQSAGDGYIGWNWNDHNFSR